MRFSTDGMKRITIFIMLGIFLLGGVIGVTLADKDSAIALWESNKITRDNEINNTLANIIFTTDKVCIVEDPIDCGVCYEITIINETINDCMGLPEGTSLDEDNLIIDEQIRNLIESIIPEIRVDYVERTMLNDTREIRIKDVKR